MTISTPSLPPLAARHQELLQSEPRLRARDAAAKLGVSEAELLATGAQGARAIRLAPRWEDLVADLESLGRVMVLTRNEWAVIEKEGPFGNIKFFGPVGQVVGEEVDLRLFTNNWRSAFAAEIETAKGERQSLQFFDRHGVAVFKIYLLPESDASAFAALVEKFRSEEPALVAEPPAARRPEQPDANVDRAGLIEAWRALTDTHDFFRLFGRFGVSRTQVLRLADADLARPIALTNLEGTLQWAAAGKHEIMVFVGNPGIVEIHTGAVNRIAEAHGWLNVLDPDFNLHVRTEGLSAAWAVAKPTSDGPVHSLEFYDQNGETVVQLFGKRKPGKPEIPAWTQHVASLS
ncbi:MAG: ChuX/HutX family heme-like substrate-binding protein [Thermoanaerobaculia bacterium]